MEHKALQLLSLARKGGNIQLGEDNVGASCRAGKARLLILANDAGGNIVGRGEQFVHSRKNLHLLRVPFTKEALGNAVGRGVCPLLALTDVSLAKAFVQALGESEKHSNLLADLEVKVARVKKRRAEMKTHEKNVKFGKKTPKGGGME